jgi:hypothetical protein
LGLAELGIIKCIQKIQDRVSGVRLQGEKEKDTKQERDIIFHGSQVIKPLSLDFMNIV